MDNLEGFKLWLYRNGRARSTIATKLDLIARILRDVSPINQGGVEEYLLTLYEDGRTASYLNTFIDSLRLYQRYLNEEEWNIPYFKEKETFKTLLSNEEIKSILELKPPRNGEKESRAGALSSIPGLHWDYIH